MKNYSVSKSIGSNTGFAEAAQVCRKMQATSLLALGAAALSLWGTAAQALGPNLVQNPSFENNTGTQFQGANFFGNQPGQTAANFPGWTVTPPSYQAIAVVGDNNQSGGNAWVQLAAWPSPMTTSGRYFFMADGDDTNGVNALISQVISGLSIGSAYQLSFDWGAGICMVVPPCDTSPPYNSGWDITFGSNIDSVNSGPVSYQSFSGWKTYNKIFTATATSQTLSFLSRGGPSGVPPISLLDNVSLKTADVPGPLGILGVATAFGYSRRLRQRIRRN
jgi:hypothetical protein